MRILLVAYDFPPVCTPRALRWRFLVRELAMNGHEVHVLCPDLGDVAVEFPRQPGCVVLHRGFPGPYGWLVRRSQRRQTVFSQAGEHQRVGDPVGPDSAALNWRGRLVDWVKRLCGRVLFPDIRVEWVPWARSALRRLLQEVRPSVVITSHEPALTLPLGRWAQRRGIPWVADLGDPVCADYTPRRWRRRAWRLEAMVSRCADLILVTTEATRMLLVERHGRHRSGCAVLPNGYDDRRASCDGVVHRLSFDRQRLELIHSGRLYEYRDSTGLLRAVRQVEGVRLTLILPDPPDDALASLLRGEEEHLRIIGRMPHGEVVSALSDADVLVNLGDIGASVQVPAKVFEYLGIARPVLHVVTGLEEDDVVAELVRPLARGWICRDEPEVLTALLRDLVRCKRTGRLQVGLSLSPVSDYAYSKLGLRLCDLLTSVAGPT